MSDLSKSFCWRTAILVVCLVSIPILALYYASSGGLKDETQEMDQKHQEYEQTDTNSYIVQHWCSTGNPRCYLHNSRPMGEG